MAIQASKPIFEASFLFVITQRIRPVSCALIGLVFVKQQAPFAGVFEPPLSVHLLKHFLQKGFHNFAKRGWNRGAIVFHEKASFLRILIL